MHNENQCSCSHHKIVPLAITLIGIVFLLGATGTLSPETVNITWPIIVIIVGLKKMMKGVCGCCK